MSTATSNLHGQARAWYKHLQQNTTWIPITGVPVRIAGMDPAWRHNAANWLLRRAAHLSILFNLGEFAALSEPITTTALRQDGDGTIEHERPFYMEMPPDVLADLLQQDSHRADNPETWLKTTPLYQALVKDLPNGIADLARHWSTCNLRTGAAATCSCNDNSPERAL